jgi:hypothetical protein
MRASGADEARVPPEQRTGLSERRQSGGAFGHEFIQTPLAKLASVHKGLRLCDLCKELAFGTRRMDLVKSLSI